MLAPERFVHWLSTHEPVEERTGQHYRYHPRSDAHSKALCKFLLYDLLDSCPLLEEHLARGLLAYGINVRYR